MLPANRVLVRRESGWASRYSEFDAPVSFAKVRTTDCVVGVERSTTTPILWNVAVVVTVCPKAGNANARSHARKPVRRNPNWEFMGAPSKRLLCRGQRMHISAARELLD